MRCWQALLFGLLLSSCVNEGVFAADQPNVLFIAIDDLRTDLGSLGVSYARSPQLDSFAKTARVFSHHFVQVPTCGASRCALLRGCYPDKAAHVGNGAIAGTQSEWGSQSLPAIFRANGYRTLALGKITHHPGGLTGKNWAEGREELPGAWDRCWIPKAPWEHAEAMMHGYANGVARRAGKSPPIEAFDGEDRAYPDAWVAAEATSTLEELSQQSKPWFLAVGFFKPHLPFAAPKQWHDLHSTGIPDLAAEVSSKPQWPSTWHNSGEFRGNYGHGAAENDPDKNIDYARELRRAYAACVSYSDAQVGKVLDSLRDLKLDQNTIVIVWSDHGFLLGEHAIWGKHCLYERALRSPLIVRVPGLKQPGATSHAIVETVDVFPTLMDLCRLSAPPTLDGKSLRLQLDDPNAKSSKPALGFWTGGQRAIRTEKWRMISKPVSEGAVSQVELFDMISDPDETRNAADERPDVVNELMQSLEIALKVAK